MEAPRFTIALLFLMYLLTHSCRSRSVEQDGGMRVTLQFLDNETSTGLAMKTIDVIKFRMEKYGIRDGKYLYWQNLGKVTIELPLVENLSQIRKLLTSEGHVEFWETFDNQDVFPLLIEANKKINELGLFEKPRKKPLHPAKHEKGKEERPVLLDEILKNEEKAGENTGGIDTIGKDNDYPLFTILYPSVDNGGNAFKGALIGRANGSDTSKINLYLKSPKIKQIFPRNMRFLWGAKPTAPGGPDGFYELYAIKIHPLGTTAPLDGSVITDASAQYSQMAGQAEVLIKMSNYGANVWARLTRENINRCIAMVFDDAVISAPLVNGEISGGTSIITGAFTINEAEVLAIMLNYEPLPARMSIVEEKRVPKK